MAGITIISVNPAPVTIFSPTAEIVDYGYSYLDFSFYKDGIINYVYIGVMDRFNLGGSWNIENLIGNEEIILNYPAFNCKYRFYDGSINFPLAMAIGFDGQEYKKWKERGIFFVGSIHLLKDCIFNFGGNINLRGKEQNKSVFFGLAALLIEKFGLEVECDRITSINEFEMNAGVSLQFSRAVKIGLFIKDIMHPPLDRWLYISYIRKI